MKNGRQTTDGGRQTSKPEDQKPAIRSEADICCPLPVRRTPSSVFPCRLSSVVRCPVSVVLLIRSVVRRLSSVVHSPSSGVRPTSGSALIIVLWVVGLLSMFVMAFAFDMHVEARITSSWRKNLKAEYLAKAGIEWARWMLLETTTDPDIGNHLDPSIYLSKGSDEKMRGAAMSLAWGGVAEETRELGEGTVTVTVCPVNVRNNLKGMIDKNEVEHPGPTAKTAAMWEPLFEAADIPFEKRDALIDCLLDWVDQDELTHLSGVESDYYESLDPPYLSKNAYPDTVEELALIKGFDEKMPESEVTIYEKLSDYLTTYPTENKININAAGRNEMMSIEIDAQLADEIIVQRQGPDLKGRTADDVLFENLGDLQTHVPGVSGLPPSVLGKIAFKPTGGLYSILVRGKVGDIEHAVACVVELKGPNLTILRWIEGDALQANLISR